MAACDMHSESVLIRAARPEDALCLGVLGAQVFLDTYATAGIRTALAREVLHSFSTAAMAAILQRPGCHVLVAERLGHLIGFAQLRFDCHGNGTAGEHPAELERMYLQAPFMGAGIGSRMLLAAQQVASQAGADVMWLSCLAGNTRAAGFYARHGYLSCGRLVFEMEGEAHENIVLQKLLVADTGL